MKKELTMLGFSVLLVAAVAFTAFDQQDKNKNPKKEQQDQGKGKEKDKDKDKEKDKENQGKNDIKDDKGKNDVNANKGNQGKIYDWNRENFKDRQKVKNQEKVTLCHKFNSGNQPVTIRVSSNAIQAHMNHGDVMGACPAGTDKRYSDDYLNKRNDYYNYLQESQEKVYYSQSILDYALTRLNDARLQLTAYRNSNMPPAEIDRRQVIVVELEQKVGVLETLVNAAANLLINKLQ